jgi:hypothetical protein
MKKRFIWSGLIVAAIIGITSQHHSTPPTALTITPTSSQSTTSNLNTPTSAVAADAAQAVAPTPTSTTPTPTAPAPTPAHTPAPATSPAPVPAPTNTGVSDTNLSNSNTYTNIDGATVHSPAASTDGTVPAGATARCNDGTYSFSQHHSGTCSGHHGVAAWL